MKDFKIELNKILEWELSERHKLEEDAVRKYGGGHDGVPPEKYKKLRDITFKKAAALKKKYGITTQNNAAYENDSSRETPRYASGK